MKLFAISILSIFMLTMIYVGLTIPEDEDSQPPRQVIGELSPETNLELYDFACEFVQDTFEDLEECTNPPVTILTAMKGGTYGYYISGSSILWINKNFSSQPNLSTYGEAITVHEAVHYLFYHYDILQDEIDYCREEKLAWEAADLWVLDRERPEDTSDEWWDWYPMCDGPDADPNSPITMKIRKIFT